MCGQSKTLTWLDKGGREIVVTYYENSGPSDSRVFDVAVTYPSGLDGFATVVSVPMTVIDQIAMLIGEEDAMMAIIEEAVGSLD